MNDSPLRLLCARLNITARVTTGNKAEPIGNDMLAWTVKLSFDGRQMTVPFFTGSGWKTAPDAADVLSCLCTDALSASETFEDWCSSLGYDTDSRKAEKTYKACVNINKKLRQFLADSFDELCQSEH